MVNAAMERVVGKSAGELLGRDDSFLFPPDEAAALMERDRTVLETGAVTTVEEALSDAGGRIATYLSTRGPLFDAAGATVGLFGITRDISDRKREERRVRGFAELSELLPVAITVNDTSGRFLYANPMACDLYGYSHDELLSLTTGDVSAPGDATLRVERARGIAEAGEASFQAEHIHRNGTALLLDCWVREAHWNGARVLLSVAVKGTRERATEPEQAAGLDDGAGRQPSGVQSESLERVGGLAGAVASELNNMLAVTLRTLDLADSMLPAGNPLRTDLDVIHQAGEHATALAQQLADLTRRSLFAPNVFWAERLDQQVSGLTSGSGQ